MRDVLIIGAGPGGACCAALLEQRGFDVALVERATFPRFTIGESLLPVTLGHLEDAGLLGAVQQGGFQNKPGAMFSDGSRVARIDFRHTANIRHGHAYNVQRAGFDALLADALAERGVDIAWNTAAEAASYDGNAWRVTLRSPEGESWAQARFLVDATGFALIPTLMGAAMPAPSPSDRGSVFCHFEDPRRPDGFEGDALWVLSNEGKLWGWLIPFSDGTASVGFAGSAELVRAAGVDDAGRLRSLMGAFAAANDRFADQPTVRITPRSIFGYQRPPITPFGKGYCLLGNSVGFLDPVFSSGLAVATQSAVEAASAIEATLHGESVDWATRYAAPLLAGVDVFSACVDSWYDRELHDLIYAADVGIDVRRDLTSILAGGAWDPENPLTTDTSSELRRLRRKLLQRRRLGF